MAVTGADSIMQMALLVTTVLVLVVLGVLFVFGLRSVRMLRADGVKVRAMLAQMGRDLEEERQGRKADFSRQWEAHLEQMALATRHAEAVEVAPPPKSQTPPRTISQQSLPLDMDQDAGDVLSKEDVILALNFPNTADDTIGFHALKKALQDRRIGRVVQVAQALLTHLSEEGLYMEDLTPDRARPDLWRRFASGERGAFVTALGGVRDRGALALATARMRRDAAFKEITHDFLRCFDQALQDFMTDATATDIAAFTDTRSARAFMLMGRVNAIFD